MQIAAPIEHLEYDILDLVTSGSKGPHKQLKYLSHLADSTPFGLIELDLRGLTRPCDYVKADGSMVREPLLSK